MILHDSLRMTIKKALSKRQWVYRFKPRLFQAPSKYIKSKLESASPQRGLSGCKVWWRKEPGDPDEHDQPEEHDEPDKPDEPDEPDEPTSPTNL